MKSAAALTEAAAAAADIAATADTAVMGLDATAAAAAADDAEVDDGTELFPDEPSFFPFNLKIVQEEVTSLFHRSFLTLYSLSVS